MHEVLNIICLGWYLSLRVIFRYLTKFRALEDSTYVALQTAAHKSTATPSAPASHRPPRVVAGRAREGAALLALHR